MDFNIGRLRMETRAKMETNFLGLKLAHQLIQGWSIFCSQPPVGPLSKVPVILIPVVHQVAHQHLLTDHLQYNH
jgi:hypothetical protein